MEVEPAHGDAVATRTVADEGVNGTVAPRSDGRRTERVERQVDRLAATCLDLRSNKRLFALVQPTISN